jgi:hypothetical protein
MNVHRQRSRGTGVLVVGAGDAPHPGVSLLRGVSDAVSWPRVAALLLGGVTIPRCSGTAALEGRPREPAHEIEPAVEQGDRQRDPFRWSQGLTLRLAEAPWLRIDHPSIRCRLTRYGLHHRSPRGKVMPCWKHVGLYGHSLVLVYVAVQRPDACRVAVAPLHDAFVSPRALTHVTAPDGSRAPVSLSRLHSCIGGQFGRERRRA